MPNPRPPSRRYLTIHRGLGVKTWETKGGDVGGEGGVTPPKDTYTAVSIPAGASLSSHR